MSKKLFEVEVKTTIVVLAEDFEEAYKNTRDELWEIKTDNDFEIDVIKCLDGELLPPDWDGMCIPYGGDGNTRIKEL